MARRKSTRPPHWTVVRHTVRTDAAPDPFWAACSCGWVGRRRPTRGAAEQDGVDHIVASARRDQ